MTRWLLLPLVLLAGLATAPAAADALLRSHALVEGDKITLGDLFDNVGDKEGIVILRAPKPGHRLTLDNDTLTHIAISNGVIWHPRGLFEEAVIERAGQVIGRDQIIASLQSALTEKNAPADALIDLDNRHPQLVVAMDSPAVLLVRDLSYDAESGKFTASVAVHQSAQGSDDDRDLSRLQVAGRLYPTVQIPVVTHMMRRGDIVTAHDIGWLKLRQEGLRAAMLTDADQLIGMVIKASIRANQPLSVGDLEKPLAVTRGALVTMVLSYSGMTLTAQGRALDQGSLGDVIRVTNSHSNLTVEGTIDGPNHLRMSLNGAIALAN